MTSECFNCKEQILFGNLLAQDFCSQKCEMEHDHKMMELSGEYDKRHLPGYCSKCGSSNIWVLGDTIIMAKTGNVMIEDSFKERPLKKEIILCMLCEGHTTNLIGDFGS